MSPKGYVHVYTGNGKGKTTAAWVSRFGLLVRDGKSSSPSLAREWLPVNWNPSVVSVT